MSRRIAQPVTQVRLTNVAVVRLHRAGKRFEIACYRNKVISWRQGVETDIDEVLQAHTVFMNVSKGVLTSSKDLQEAFGTDDQEKVIRHILDKGEYHASDKERDAMLESLFRDIATIVSEKSVNPTSNRPYTVTMIQNAMREIHYAVNPSRSAKQQALDIIRRLKEKMPIERARMHLRVSCQTEDKEAIKTSLAEAHIAINTETTRESSWEADMLVDPGLFRVVDEIVRTTTKGKGSLHVIQLNVQQEGEADVDLELARKQQNLLKQANTTAQPTQAAEVQEGVGQLHIGDDEDDEDIVDMPLPRSGGGRDDENGRGAKQKQKKKGKKGRRRDDEDHAGDSDEGGSTTNSTTTSLPPPPPKAVLVPGTSGGSGSRLVCNTCKVGFGDVKDHREHYRTNWHRYNLKLKEKGGGPVSEVEFSEVDAEELFFQDRVR